MSALLRAELLKLRTTRTFAALVGAALALSLLVVVLTAVLVDDLRPQETRDLFAADFTGLFILLLGIVGMAGEWRHRTISATVLAAPRRWQLLAAKALSYAAAGALLSLVVTLTIMAVGTIILSQRAIATPPLADLADVLWRNLLVATLVGALGVCVGALVRSQVVAIVGVLVLGFVAEPALFALVPEVGRFAPTQNVPSAIIGFGSVGSLDDGQLLAPGIAILVMLGWVALFFAAAGARLRRGDLV